MATGDILAQVADQRTSEEILQKINDANIDIENNFKLVNSTIGTDNPVSLDAIILQAVYGNVFEYQTAGTFELLIPATVSKIKITACGAGGGGGGASSAHYGSGGGGGGDAIVDREYSVVPQSKISITVGKGGVAERSKNGTDGGATIIGDLVTLAGGKGGTVGTASNHIGTGGQGSGNGGAGTSGAYLAEDQPETLLTTQTGGNGLIGKGGAGTSITVRTDIGRVSACGIGGAGGGSLGNGGGANTHYQAGTKPTRGGGGGGGSYWYNGSNNISRQTNGADGYVKIVWGY